MYFLMYKPKYNFFWPNKSKNTEAIIKSDDACILFLWVHFSVYTCAKAGAGQWRRRCSAPTGTAVTVVNTVFHTQSVMSFTSYHFDYRGQWD